jgi:antitoxin PrlF
MSEARMTSKGQITVPRDVRLKLNLKPGDRVLFIVEDDGAVRMRAANRRAAVARALGHDRD